MMLVVGSELLAFYVVELQLIAVQLVTDYHILSHVIYLNLR